MAVFDSYSSRMGEIFFNEIYKSSKQINSQKTSQSILFMCRAKFGTNQLKSLKIPSMFSKIYRYFWRFSTTAKLHPSCIYRPFALTSQILKVSSRCSLTISVRVQQPHTAQELTILIQNYYKLLKNLLCLQKLYYA